MRILLFYVFLLWILIVTRSAAVGGEDVDEDNGEEEHDVEEEEEQCEADGGTTTTCSSSVRGYDPLVEPGVEPWHDERPETCNDSEFWRLDWKTLHVFKSKYQHVEFCQDPRNGDMCLDLDNIIQICASYRPHYHEMMVHYPARYLAKVRRVAFIGGGDSMLLHEVLKYPDLELVIGLELDQQVTRGSFMYFGTQPHWDDPRVEWWFGDATKSLLILPRSYFGSFDLVLVDLSETVMALSVTDELDVMQSLAMLLKPDGVFVQNEIMHFQDVSNHFQYTMHSHLYDVPIVCSQSIIIGSHTVDLFRTRHHRHNVSYLLTGLLDDDEGLTFIVHDFQRNMSNIADRSRPCRPAPAGGPGKTASFFSSSSKGSSAVQAGVLMVVDAERLREDVVRSPDSMVAVATRALAAGGFELVSSVVSSNVHRPTAFSESSSPADPTTTAAAAVQVTRAALILKQGYVTVNCLPEIRYCAVDLHLWARLDQQSRLKASLLEALGSASGSSNSSANRQDPTFRIVAGGMMGAQGFDDDVKNRGPLSVPVCATADDAADHRSLAYPPPEPDPSVFSTAQYRKVLRHVTDLFVNSGKGGSLVAILCGPSDKLCPTASVFKDSSKVLELRPCADLTEGIEYSKLAPSTYQRCENELLQAITAFVDRERFRLEAIVVDPSAPSAAAQIVLHIFKSKAKQKRFMTENRLVAAPMLEPWHRVFIDKFRTEAFLEEPVFRAEVHVSGAEGSFGLALCSSGDIYFVWRLYGGLETLEAAMPGLSAEVRLLRGPWDYAYLEAEPVAEYTHLHYNQSAAFAQWKSQRELLRQAVVQFALSGPTTTQITSATIKSALERSIVASFGKVVAAETRWLVESASVGYGSVVVALLQGWSIVVVWDGRANMNANILTYDEDEEFGVELIVALKETFNLETALFDEYPRGIGGVVNWLEDSDGVFPIWAEALKQREVGAEL